jgi:hypothetical protein
VGEWKGSDAVIDPRTAAALFLQWEALSSVLNTSSCCTGIPDIRLAGEVAQTEDTSEMQQHQPGLEAHLFPSPVQLLDFVREGWRRLSGKEGEQGLQPEIIRSDDFYLTPAFQTGTTILLPINLVMLYFINH